MAGNEWTDKFPQLTPVKSAPALFRYNGCGVALYGNRDHDAETDTFVATWCLSLLFVPILCLRAYRVAHAPKGWYFIGRVPLSTFAKACNAMLVASILVIIAGIQYDDYTSSPSYQAKKQMAAAHKLAGEGHIADGARIYQTLVVTNTAQADNATAAIKALMDNECRQAPLSESAGVYGIATQVARRSHAIPASDIIESAIKLVADKGDADPRSGVGVLDAVRPLVVDTRAVDARRLVLLQKWAVADPGNLEVIVPLASLLADQQHDAEAKKLLLPYKDKLGDGDGARVLGSILGREGDLDGAYALLWPYVKTRLDRFHDAEKGLDDTWKRLSDQQIDLLDQKKAPQDFYDKYQSASKEQQKAMVQEYLNAHIRNDPAFTGAQEALEHETAVVPVALELGMVMLQRAQEQTNPDVRKSQLKSAEDTFLAIGGVAGERDEYRISLGQVDYWLGKQADGRKLFDDFLAAKGRTFESLLAIATRLRQLGAETEARAMAEEAYNKGSKAEEQHEAANLRALLFKDTDDQIVWLNKSDTANSAVKAQLAQAQGNKAFEEGHDDEAAREYHVAADTYSAMPRSATTLNETALAYDGIFRATGDHASLEKCIDNFQQAVDLNPTDSILLINAGYTLLSAALSDVTGSDIDLRALHEVGSTSLLGNLYQNEAGREPFIKRVKDHPGITRAVAYLEKAMVLSPRDSTSFAVVNSIHRFTHNDAALLDLQRRLQAADLDTSDALVQTKEYLSGEKDQQDTAARLAALKRSEDQANLLRPRGDATAAVAISEQVENMIALAGYTDSVDADKTVALAEESHRLHPSSVSLNVLIAADLLRGAKHLRASNPAFAAFYGKYSRSLGITYLMAAAVSEPGPFQSSVVGDPDVKKAAALVIEEVRNFPKDRSAYEWAILKGVDSAEADKTADFIRHDPRSLVAQSISTILRPADAGNAMETYWLMTIDGKPDEARAAVRKVADAGIPMPIQP